MTTVNQRRHTLLLPLIILVGFVACGQKGSADNSASKAEYQLKVYKRPSCSCCSKWIAHLEDSGFSTISTNIDNLSSIKSSLGVKSRYQSCHTAISTDGDYVFEGHIPADQIRRFLADRPKGAIGLSVPGMPPGSPGMEVSNRFSPYDVLILFNDKTSEVYEHIEAKLTEK